MKFVALAFNIIEEDIKTIRAVFKVITDQEIEILDLMNYEMNRTEDYIVITFGTRAAKQAKEIKCISKLELPEVDKLDKKFGDQELRNSTHQSLLKFKELVNNPNQRVIVGWAGTTEEGKVIKVTEKLEASGANTNITWTELEKLDKFMKAFNIREARFIYGNSKDNSK